MVRKLKNDQEDFRIFTLDASRLAIIIVEAATLTGAHAFEEDIKMYNKVVSGWKPHANLWSLLKDSRKFYRSWASHIELEAFYDPTQCVTSIIDLLNWSIDIYDERVGWAKCRLGNA